MERGVEMFEEGLAVWRGRLFQITGADHGASLPTASGVFFSHPFRRRERHEEPNLCILDQPTNHLDIEGPEALEAEMMQGEAAGLLVSHDRRFAERVGTASGRLSGAV